MVAEALSPRWEWVSGDWAGWDFQSSARVQLEVKQSAARQSWATDTSESSKCAFDIAARTGHWARSNWVAGHGRNAAIYILAHHPGLGVEADHREPKQWNFYVISETALPPGGKTISLSRVKQLVSEVGIQELAHRVQELETKVLASRL